MGHHWLQFRYGQNTGILRCAQNDKLHLTDRHYSLAPLRSSSRARMPMSLSPRPERLTMMTSVLAMVGARRMASETAWALSRAGMMPSVRERVTVALRASSSEQEV